MADFQLDATFNLEAELARVLDAAQVGSAMRGEIEKSYTVRLILAQAWREMMTALHEFETANPYDVLAIGAIQTRYKRYRELARWIGGALDQGDEAFSKIIEDLEADNRLRR